MAFDKAAYMRAYNRLPATKQRLIHWYQDRHRRRSYGISYDEFIALASTSDDHCPICEVNPATHVDHDHDTGVIRGVICNGCNRVIGRFDKNKGMLERLMRYYEKAKKSRQGLDKARN